MWKALIALDGRTRFIHSVKRICDFGRVWFVCTENDEVEVLADNDDNDITPIWPYAEAAEAWLAQSGDPAHSKVVSVDVYDFLDGGAELSISNDHLYAVFTLPTGNGPVLSGTELSMALREELRKYE